MTYDAEHSFGRNADNRPSRESVFDNGIRKGGRAFRQLPAIASFFVSVDAAARHAVESTFSALKHAEAMA
jgi:hypothetical protein